MNQWGRDLALGFRFAFAGGREGWTRALLTAVGVGLGVTLLLLTTAIPNALAARDDRGNDRTDITYSGQVPAKADNTLVVADADTDFRGAEIRGRTLEPEGPRAPLPPGVDSFPAVGEMVVCLLYTSYKRQDLTFYRGGQGIGQYVDGAQVTRIDRYGDPDPYEAEADPVLILLILVVFVALLMPVAVFIAAAVRFGGERRDRRLAALRLVGSDGRMTRRIAAGEALAGALLGLVFGTVFFLIGRQIAGSVEVFRFSVFPADLNPSPALALLVAVLVPAAAVLVTLLALRGVVIEPLGVVTRHALPDDRQGQRRRRLQPVPRHRRCDAAAGRGDRPAPLGRGDGRRPPRRRWRGLATGRTTAPVEQRHGRPAGERRRGGGCRCHRAPDAVRRGGAGLHQGHRLRPGHGADGGDRGRRRRTRRCHRAVAAHGGRAPGGLPLRELPGRRPPGPGPHLRGDRRRLRGAARGGGPAHVPGR